MFSLLKAAKIGDGLGAGACAWAVGAHLERTGAGIYTALLLATLRGYPRPSKIWIAPPPYPDPSFAQKFFPTENFFRAVPDNRQETNVSNLDKTRKGETREWTEKIHVGKSGCH